MTDQALLAELRQSLGLLQVAFDAASEAMVIVEPGGEVRWGNQSAADLWTNGLAIFLVGQRLEQLLQSVTGSNGQSLSLDSADHPLQRIRRGDGSGTFQMAGTLIQLEWRRIPQPGDGYLLLLARDLVPQEQALQQQRRFLNELAHELNTPLAIVSGSLKRLGHTALSLGHEPMQWLQQAQQETGRLARLLRNLLTLSDLEAGRQQLHLRRVSLQDWLQQWCGQQLLPEGVVLELLPSQLASTDIDVDVEALAEVLAQLFDNSLRYSSAPAQIQLKLSSEAEQLVLQWQDHGPGIEPSSRQQIFERFVRLEEHRDSAQADGAGLGLALCEALMDSMGGSIALEASSHPSHGALFVLRWPQLLGR